MASVEVNFKQFLWKINALQQLDHSGQSGFARDFQMLRQTSMTYKTSKTYLTEAGECATNRVKNRFKDILPFDYTRVKLPSTGADGSDYINANLIKGVNNTSEYIASQGPLPNTVNDFWRMLWSFKVKVVVMLCRESENGKKKCQRYWCENNEEKLDFGGIQVKVKKCIAVGNNFVMRTLVAEKEGEERTLTQFHYTAWPDHGVPPTATPLIDLVKLVREYQSEDNPPIILHCSAGCGRTGTICALDYAQGLLKQGRAKEVDPYQIVENLRKQRAAMVQTKGQYEFLCRAMCAIFRMQLNLPMEEELEKHVYENITMGALIEESDSDMSPSPRSPATFEAFANKLPIKKDKTTFAAQEQAVGRKKPPVSGPPTPSDNKRVNQISQQAPSDSYVNVTFDLIDLTDDGSSPKTNIARTAGKSQVNTALLSKRLSQKGQQKDHFDKPDAMAEGKHVGVTSQKMFVGCPASRQYSSEDYAVPLKSWTPGENSEIVLPRGKQSQVPPAARFEKQTSLPAASIGQNYENVPDSHFRPSNHTSTATNGAPVPASYNYENVEVKSSNPERRQPVSPSPRTQHEKTGVKESPKPSPKPKLENLRSKSTDEEPPRNPTKLASAKPFSSCGPKSGARGLEQAKASNGRLQRAKILPSEDMGQNDQQLEAELERKFFSDNDVTDGLYASVGSRHKSSARKQITDSTFRNEDIVDGVDHGPEVPTKSPDFYLDSSKSESKTSSLTKKILFLNKKPEGLPVEPKGLPVENIGFGIRLAKPKGPRNTPKRWAIIKT